MAPPPEPPGQIRAPTERLLLLGEQHHQFGDLAVKSSGPGRRTAAAVSAGGETARRRKADLTVANEDCAVVLEQGPRTVLAVCDGHHGHWSSHALASSLASPASTVPSDPAALQQLANSLVRDPPPADVPARDEQLDSGTTLAVAVLDRDQGRLFGICYGDSSVFLMPDAGATRRCVGKGSEYVCAWQRSLPAPDGRFDLRLGDADLVLVCSDGVDECHYEQPLTSIGIRHLDDLRRVHGHDPEALARAIGELALRGVDGNPGGQDNIALLVSAGWPAVTGS